MYRSLIFIFLQFYYAHSQSCDYSSSVVVGTTYNIQSPNYPNNYVPGTTCRWIATCPNGYNCRVDCILELPQTANCNSARLLISTTGDPQLAGANYYCGQGTVSVVSINQQISIGLISSTDSSGGKFRCYLYAQAASNNQQCTCGVRRANRIVGGNQTSPYEYPSIAGIRYLPAQTIRCGAAIIANNYVLTAAHCVNTKTINELSVEVGIYRISNSPYRQSLSVLEKNVHPSFSESNYDCDIALLRTSTMAFNDYVSPVCLPFKFANSDFTGTAITLLGWGTTVFGGPRSDVLLKVDVNVVSQTSCRSSVPSLTPRQLCTFSRGKDACQDDSGGPGLYTDPQTGLLYIVGIISYGLACASDTPGINTRVTLFLDWIQQKAPANYCRK